jgi:predicted acyl esterase
MENKQRTEHVGPDFTSADEWKTKMIRIKYADEEVDVIHGVAPNLHDKAPPLRTGETAVEEGILIEYDIPIAMRDGVTIYVDVFRPEGAKDIPAIIAFGFSRKMAGVAEHGVPPGTSSKYHKFEAPDPFYWCHNGYAVINTDSRGCGQSGGESSAWSTQNGRDGYDVVEWVASQEWSNGKVGAFGNSGVGGEILQTAVQQPPHLACIAPWETTTDLYRASVSPGGIPEVGFYSVVPRNFQGYHQQWTEDLVANREKYPYMNGFWKDKIVKLEEIEVPMYACAGWSHFHLRGSIDMFVKAGTPKKWLRAHRDFEWPDDWQPDNIKDLTLFFDRYLKGVRNGWEMTPRVRLEVMDSFDFDYQRNRPEKEWPLARTKYTKLFLDAQSLKMYTDEITSVSVMEYDSASDHAVFTHTFTEETELTGHMKLRLWVESRDHDEMDLFIFVQKESAEGVGLPTLVLGQAYPGAMGYMRVSLRTLDEKESTFYRPVQSFLESKPLSKGEIVPVDIEVLPISRIWHKGEKLRLVITGRYEREPGWFEPFLYNTNNKGEHIIHTGGKYDSHLLVPVIPPKLTAGDYVYR